MPNNDIDKRDPRGWTPLMIAARFGTEQQVRALLTLGAHTQVKDRFSLTPLAIASYYNPSVIPALLEARANTSGPNRYDRFPLHHAARYGDAQLLNDALNSGAKPDDTDTTNHTPLSIAVRYANPEMIVELIKAGANIEGIAILNARTPLQVAAQYGPPQNVTTLLEHGANASATTRNKKMETPLMLAAKNRRHPKSIHPLTKHPNSNLEHPNADFRTPLLLAINSALPENVRELLLAGANPNTEVDGSYPALLFAYEALGRSKPAELEEIVNLLLGAGADTNPPNYGSALAYAAHKGAPNNIKQLCDAGVPLDGPGVSPLSAAISGNARDNVNYLLELGVSPDGQLDAYISPLEEVIKSLRHINNYIDYHHILDDLLAAGANPNVKPTDPRELPLVAAAIQGDDKIMNKLLAFGAELDGAGKNGFTALIAAAHHQHEALVELLINRRANVNATCDRGRTALFYATQHNGPLTARLLLAAGINTEIQDHEGDTALSAHCNQAHARHTALLLAAGANPNAQNTLGNTPLHHSAGNYFGDAALSLLIKAGANPSIKNAEGDTPLEYGKKHSGTTPETLSAVFKQTRVT